MKAILLSFSFFSFHCTRPKVVPGRLMKAWRRPSRAPGSAAPASKRRGEIASRRLTFIVKHQNLSMPLMRASLPLRKPRVSGIGLTPGGTETALNLARQTELRSETTMNVGIYAYGSRPCALQRRRRGRRSARLRHARGGLQCRAPARAISFAGAAWPLCPWDRHCCGSGVLRRDANGLAPDRHSPADRAHCRVRLPALFVVQGAPRRRA